MRNRNSDIIDLSMKIQLWNRIRNMSGELIGKEVKSLPMIATVPLTENQDIDIKLTG